MFTAFILVHRPTPPSQGGRWACARRGLRVGLAGLLLGLALLWPKASTWAQGSAGVQIQALNLHREDEGVSVDYALGFELGHAVQDALQRGVPLHFVAEARVMRYRWYWRDAAVSHAIRQWRLTYQPLTRQYRLSLGGLAQAYERLDDALDVVRRGTRWRVAEPLPPGVDDHYYLDFSFRLDTSQLPGPLQLGLETQPEWNLGAGRSIPLPELLRP